MGNLMNALEKFSKSPGTCAVEEVLTVEEFFKEYIKIRDIYKSVFRYEPIGLTLESQMESIEYYKNYYSKIGRNK